MGRDSRYRATQGTAICKVFDLTFAMTGLRRDSPAAQGHGLRRVYLYPADHAGYYPGASAITLKLLFEPGSGRILGAQAVGKAGVDKRIDILAVAQRAGLTVFDLEDLELCYAPPYGSAKDPVNMAGFVAANVLRGDVDLWEPEELAGLGDGPAAGGRAHLPGERPGHHPGRGLRAAGRTARPPGGPAPDKELLVFCQAGCAATWPRGCWPSMAAGSATCPAATSATTCGKAPARPAGPGAPGPVRPGRP